SLAGGRLRRYHERMKRHAPSLAIAAALLGSAGVLVPSVPPSAADDFTPVVGEILSSHTMPVRGSDGRMHVVYELLLTNAKAVPATLEKIEITAADGV